MRAWVITTTAFTFEGSGDGISLALWAGDFEDFVTATDYSSGAQSSLASGARKEREPTALSVIMVETDCDLMLGCVDLSSPPDAGSTQVYALIAEPAS